MASSTKRMRTEDTEEPEMGEMAVEVHVPDDPQTPHNEFMEMELPTSPFELGR